MNLVRHTITATREMQLSGKSLLPIFIDFLNSNTTQTFNMQKTISHLANFGYSRLPSNKNSEKTVVDKIQVVQLKFMAPFTFITFHICPNNHTSLPQSMVYRPVAWWPTDHKCTGKASQQELRQFNSPLDCSSNTCSCHSGDIPKTKLFQVNHLHKQTTGELAVHVYT